MTFSFSIPTWQAVTPNWQSKDEWKKWAENPQQKNDFNVPPNLDFIPPIQRRRLSLSARLMFAAAQPIIQQYGNCPLIYCSHDGELNRSFELWLELLQNHSLSPTSFGLSVHNALSGQWSIFSKNYAEQTALCATELGLETAIIEAFIMLIEGHEKILILIVDEPLQPKYTLPNITRASFPYALALLVTAGKQYQLTRTTASNKKQNYASALPWIKAQVLRQFPLQQGEWLWTVQ